MTTTPDLEARLDLLLERLSLEQKVGLLTGASLWTLGSLPDIGLREIVFSDGPSGVRGPSWDERTTSLNLPSATAIGAGWNPNLVRHLGIVLAGEAREKGVDVILAPTINLQRSPLGGRHFEAFSEDPMLTGEIAAAIVAGIQSQGVAATAKHYVCNDSETERMNVDVKIGERALREIYLAPFEKLVVDAKTWLVMSGYNAVNGTTMSENRLLTSPLKDEWAFDGVVISDWACVRSTEESAAAGQDLVMPGPDGPWGDALVAAVQNGTVPEATIDDKVRRILRMAARVGALEGSATLESSREAAGPGPVEFGPVVASAPTNPDGIDLAYLAGIDSMVLLRNAGPGGVPVLPAPAAEVTSVAVIGQSALVPRHQGGGSAQVHPHHVVTALDGLRARYDDVTYALGASTVRGFQPFNLNDVRDPVTMEHGIRLRYLGEGDEVILEETRLAANFMWMGDPIIAETRTVELRTMYCAATGGDHGFGVAGLGDFEIAFDGEIVAKESVDFDSVDPVIGMLDPPQRITRVNLKAGQVLELRVRFRVEVHQMLSTFAIGCGVEVPRGTEEEELAKAVELAAASDLAVVVVGTSSTEESEGFDRVTLSLPGRQDDLVRAVIKANPRTVVVVNSGGPVLMPWLEDAAATILMWFPGQEGGRALADVIAGLAEPGGRMPTTWTMSESDVPVLQVNPTNGMLHYGDDIHCGYREWARRVALGGPKPAAIFGAGLGYTTWEFLAAAPDPKDPARIDVRVRNTGERAGKVVVQGYLAKPDSGVERPVIWLAAFQPQVVAAQAEAVVSLQLSHRAFEYWSTELACWVLEEGDYELKIGPDAGNPALSLVLRR